MVVRKGLRTSVGLAVIALLSAAVLTPTAASATPKDQAKTTPMVATSTDRAAKPMRKPGATQRLGLQGRTCGAVRAGSRVCVQPVAPRLIDPDGVSTKALVDFPAWCTQSGGDVYALRTAACQITGVLLTTYRTVNGVTTVTGEAQMDVWQYSYSAVDLPNWGHQIGVASWQGFGDALRASVSGSAGAAGRCTNTGSSFPSQPITPFLTLRQGESYATTTATTVGAVGTCTTTWNLTFNTPGYPPAGTSESMNEIRCDNAVGANGFRPARVGCVVPWYPDTTYYSRSSYPSLASHVSRAQASGLPGSSFAAPLWRTTSNSINTANRNLACGDAPSIAGLSCDEYPLASTYNGLAFGGTRRSFPNCNINAPQATGPSGASACMITATENNAQGGLMAKFYYDSRVLDADPYLIAISA
jgi:hypothetical protein